MSLRNITERDLDALQDLFGSVSVATGTDSTSEVNPPKPAREWLEMRWAGHKDGAFVQELDGVPIGAVLTTLWGRTGWIGPLAVDRRHQGKGYGTALLEEAAGALEGSGATVIGIEIPAVSERALGFLVSRGYRPQTPVLEFEKQGEEPVVPEGTPEPAYFSSLLDADREGYLQDVRNLSAAMDADLDYATEVEAVESHRMGDSLLLRGPEGPLGLAICHTRPHFTEGEGDPLRIQALCLNEPGPHESMESLLGVVGLLAREVRSRRIRLDAPARNWEGVRHLLQAGFRIAGVRQRLTLLGYPDRSDAGRINLARWG